MNSKLKLFISIVLDIIGVLSYITPLLELSDIIYAPLYGFWIHHAYGSKRGAMIGTIEELLPFTDIIPTATIIHLRQ